MCSALRSSMQFPNWISLAMEGNLIPESPKRRHRARQMCINVNQIVYLSRTPGQHACGRRAALLSHCLSRCLYLHAPLHVRRRQFATSGHPRLKHCWCEYGTRNLGQKYSIPSAGMSACRYSHVLCRLCCSHCACTPHFILIISCCQSSEDAQGRMANPTVVMELGIQSVDNRSSVNATMGTVAGYSCIVGSFVSLKQLSLAVQSPAGQSHSCRIDSRRIAGPF